MQCVCTGAGRGARGPGPPRCSPDHLPACRRQNGEPLTDNSLYKLFWTTSYRLTGKKVGVRAGGVHVPACCCCRRGVIPIDCLLLPSCLQCNPHLIRDSIVTYLRGSGASERELEVGVGAGLARRSGQGACSLVRRQFRWCAHSG